MDGPAAGGARGRSTEDVRRHNLRALLGLVHTRGGATRAEVTRELGLNRSTTGTLVGALVEAGLLVEQAPVDQAPGRVGRPSLEVRPRDGGAEVLAGYVDVHAVQVVRVGLGGVVRGRRTVATPAPPSPERAAEVLAGAAAALLAESPPGLLAGVGVAVPGLVRAGDGVIAHAPNLDWRDVPLAALVTTALEDATGHRLRVDVANDADLGLLAEHRRGAAAGLTDVVYLCGTHGLGGGVLTGGHPLTGHRGYAGEVGHVSVDPDGRACRCGSRGCWESETLAAAWAEPFGLDGDAPDLADLVLARLAAGGVVSRRTRDKLSRAFARGLANIVHLFDPQAVVLGEGLWHRLWPEVREDVMPWVDRLVMPAMRAGVSVRTSALGEGSTVLGAAELALTPLLEDPLGPLAVDRERAPAVLRA
ncbi:putative NBD/HSP70 family sugar kinase [Kineococcus radiotolerans]|uniref:ROK family protein n=2 Tax=Kineococcus radiotolerans TaxID=131568 RepID=A6W788_KINRD|nr:ROK family transcriptional regulator [Kineococcus radiotolerans]ABS02677.1 ROK family protein [Kineococcus radiotolerans SRS30216 = ATCC BAA-149]MBB2900135.1 putative NBD/HSP70 family sugar kinase [Kineococcus radiotolerans]